MPKKLASVARDVAKEFSDFESQFLASLPSHYTPDFYDGRLHDDSSKNPYVSLRLCRVDIDVLLNALSCLEHWFMTKEVSHISSSYFGDDVQIHHRLEFKSICSLIDFLTSCRPVVSDDVDTLFKDGVL